MLDFSRNYPSNLSRHWKQRIEIWLSLWLKWRQGLISKEIHEKNVINSFRPVITITQRKDIRYCIFIYMFLKRKNIKGFITFHYFLNALWRARFNLPLISYPVLPRPEWDLGTRLKLTPPSFTELDSTDSCSPWNLKFFKETNMFLLSCVHVRNWESTNFNLIPRSFSAIFRLRGTHLFIFSTTCIVDCLNL